MTSCNQKKCRFVARDSQHGHLVCVAPNRSFTRVLEGRSFIMNCQAYERRASWLPGLPDAGIPMTAPQEDEEGLYPGQLQPPPDFSDVDPEEASMLTITSDLTKRWEERLEYVTEPECDT